MRLYLKQLLQTDIPYVKAKAEVSGMCVEKQEGTSSILHVEWFLEIVPYLP